MKLSKEELGKKTVEFHKFTAQKEKQESVFSVISNPKL